ncbi:MAG TPA: hypothetical protein PLZ32_18535, partial [Saprospiraceae bacterium]|nr:hypothetical protein [Saprospiraceae bacterium]
MYSTQNHYSENFEYDVRGNILGLDRKGMVNQSWINGSCFAPATIDSLTYSYASGTNRLVQVSDAAPCADTLQLPPLLDRDMIYAADDILVNTSSVVGGTELQLEAGDEITVFQNLQLQ